MLVGAFELVIDNWPRARIVVDHAQRATQFGATLFVCFPNYTMLGCVFSTSSAQRMCDGSCHKLSVFAVTNTTEQTCRPREDSICSDEHVEIVTEE